MRTLKMILVIIAIALVSTGVVIVILGFMNHKKAEIQTKTYEITENFSNYDINMDITSFEIQKSTADKIELVIDEQEKYSYTFNVENNTFKLRINDKRKWYEKLFLFNFKPMKAILKTPETSFDNLKVELSTGDVKVPSDFEFNSIDLKASTGNIEFKSQVNNNVKVEASTGNIKLSNINCNSLNAETSTGNITLDNIKSLTEIKLTASTGDITLTKVEAMTNLKIETSTGDVNFESIDAANIRIETSTGDVKGSILTAKTFDVDSSTGKRDYPRGTSGNPCYVRTSTGNINISIINQ